MSYEAHQDRLDAKREELDDRIYQDTAPLEAEIEELKAEKEELKAKLDTGSDTEDGPDICGEIDFIGNAVDASFDRILEAIFPHEARIELKPGDAREPSAATAALVDALKTSEAARTAAEIRLEANRDMVMTELRDMIERESGNAYVMGVVAQLRQGITEGWK